MPCSCQIPTPAYPENKEWGPFAWRILHSLAERVTRVIIPLYENDERRAWIQLLQNTRTMLPCDNCRDHYKVWLDAHPVTEIQTMPYSSLREWIRRWLWELHNDVNLRLGKASLPYESLSATYSNFNPMDFKLFDLIEKRAIQQGGVHLVAWNNWIKQYRTIVSVYGL